MSHGLEFTTARFIRIATTEARRGRDDPGQMFPEVRAVISDLKDLHKQRRDACAPLWKTDEKKARETYAEFRVKINERQAAKHRELEASLQQVSTRLSTTVANGTFVWGLEKGLLRKKRQTYMVDNGPDVYFPMKQLQVNLRSTFQLTPPNRNRLVSQLNDSLEGKLPRFVLRTDIKSFYESIPHTELLRLLSDRDGLSRTSLQLITALLAEWTNLTSTTNGIPTGVGLSAYLGEAYARRVDAVLAGHPAVHFYGRYVDDIVIVTRSSEELDIAETVLKSVTNRLGLSLNACKTKRITPAPNPVDAFDFSRPFDFLGYSIKKTGGVVTIDLSKSTIDRYKTRVEASFAVWVATKNPTSGHEGLLLDRIRFLTGNTKLINSKGRAVTGIYFNYPQVTASQRAFSTLDKHLRYQIRTHAATLPERLVTRLGAASFTTGFTNRTFHRFRQSDLERLVAVWRE